MFIARRSQLLSNELNFWKLSFKWFDRERKREFSKWKRFKSISLPKIISILSRQLSYEYISFCLLIFDRKIQKERQTVFNSPPPGWNRQYLVLIFNLKGSFKRPRFEHRQYSKILILYKHPISHHRFFYLSNNGSRWQFSRHWKVIVYKIDLRSIYIWIHLIFCIDKGTRSLRKFTLCFIVKQILLHFKRLNYNYAHWSLIVMWLT